jgi:myo-inositol 2-dehydrogenase / D-chiro-inositol 1-dehydrogenase
MRTAATSVAAANLLLPKMVAADPKNKKVKLAVIGTGGRSNRDIPNFIKACGLLGLEAEIVMLADAFADQVGLAAEKYGVSRDRCVVGWDAYRKVAESAAEFVMVITPPLFRPLHFELLVEAGKHVLLEKPVAVDAPGCRRIIAAGEKARKQGLAVVAGTQRRHELSYLECKAKIDAGAIGDLTGGQVVWNTKVPWINDRQAGWSDAEYLGRNWLNWSEMSGDHIGEQHVHNLDVANWFIGRLPVSAIGYGGRARRETGNNFDFFSLDLDYGEGVHVHSQCRQISGTYTRVGESFQGTKGEALGGGKVSGIKVSIPQITVLDIDGSVQEIVDWIVSARSGHPINEARQIAESTAVAIMGRYAAYTGKFVRLRDLLENETSPLYGQTVGIMPEDFERGPVACPPENVVPVPGDGEPIRRK